jgi:hypothetical protein
MLFGLKPEMYKRFLMGMSKKSFLTAKYAKVSQRTQS